MDETDVSSRRELHCVSLQMYRVFCHYLTGENNSILPQTGGEDQVFGFWGFLNSVVPQADVEQGESSPNEAWHSATCQRGFKCQQQQCFAWK